MTSARPAPDLEAEAEVDVAGYARAIVLRWWLLLVGLVAGALIGYASTLGGAQLYRASAVVYLGQPLGALSQTIQSLNTNPSAVKTIVTSQSAAERAARKSGLRPGQIRSNVLVNQVAGSLSKVGQSPLVQITVKGSQKTKVRLAANALAAIVVNKLSGPARAKIAIFQPGADRDRAVIASVEEALAHPRDLNFTDKLLLQTRLQNAQADLTQVSQQLTVAKTVESPSVVTAASSVKTSVRNRRNSALVGAVIGLIVGAIAALLWEPVARARRHP
jgi:uncharacterized protein involved in exopolysaccharide biosynthesis